MVEITASLVKELRERTGAGMMDCKKALSETSGDIEAAIDWLRKKGLSAASKKADRVAAEGLVAIFCHGGEGAIVEVNAETDFVARNEKFQEYAKNVSQLAHKHKGDFLGFSEAAYGHGTSRSVSEELTNLIAVIGENMKLRRMARLEVAPGVVTGYVHGAVAPGMGRLGVLVSLESSADAKHLSELGHQIAMHIAATNPASVDVESLNPELVEREKAVLIDQARSSGKPEAVIEKMIEGRLRKFYEEIVLLEQAFIMNPDITVKKLLEQKAKEWGTSVTLSNFVRFALGEGVEKAAEQDFAAEVGRLAQ
ncbi:MAG: translation elongation factor Ts [Alphaproteobacteria bacterium]